MERLLKDWAKNNENKENDSKGSRVCCFLICWKNSQKTYYWSKKCLNTWEIQRYAGFLYAEIKQGLSLLRGIFYYHIVLTMCLVYAILSVVSLKTRYWTLNICLQMKILRAVPIFSVHYWAFFVSKLCTFYAPCPLTK